MPKVSVVIPIYNLEDYLKNTIDYLKQQTLSDFETIFVDDGSTDNSANIITRYTVNDSRFRLIKQDNKGAAAARNRGLDLATGETIMWLDGDDIFMPDLLEKVYKRHQETKAQIVIYKWQDFNPITGELALPPNWTAKAFPADTFSYRDLHCRTTNNKLFSIALSMPWNRLFETTFVRDSKIRFDESVRVNDDTYATWMYMALADKIAIVDDVLLIHCHYRSGSQPFFRQNKPQNTLSYDFATFHKLKDELINRSLYKDLADDYLYQFMNNFNSLLDHNHIDLSTLKDSLDPLINNNESWLMIDLNKQQQHQLSSWFESLASIVNTTKTDRSTDKKIKNATKKVISKIDPHYRYENYILDLERQLWSQNEKILSYTRKLTRLDYLLKKEQLRDRMEFYNHQIFPHSILLVEFNDWHGEFLFANAIMLSKLGYQVDVLLTPHSAINEDSFGEYYDHNIRIYPFEQKQIAQIIRQPIVSKYEWIFFNSLELSAQAPAYKVFDAYATPYKAQKGFVTVSHYPAWTNKRFLKKTKLISYTNDKSIDGVGYTTVVPIYPLAVAAHQKTNSYTQFIVVGNLTSHSKNTNLLVDAIDKLYQKKHFNFHVTVIGSGQIENIPHHLRSFITCTGRIDYPTMYQHLRDADFLLTLLDPNDTRHERYLYNGSSGSFFNSYGFRLPCLIPEKFAKRFSFNQHNSIIIAGDSDLADGMQTAINLSVSDYDQMVAQLDKDCRQFISDSLNNLKKILD